MADNQPLKREIKNEENIMKLDDDLSREDLCVDQEITSNFKKTDLKTFTNNDTLNEEKIMKPSLDIHVLDQEDLVLSYQQQAKEETGNTEPSELICPRLNLPAINKTDEIAFQSNSIHSLKSKLSDEMDTSNKSHVFVTV